MTSFASEVDQADMLTQVMDDPSRLGEFNRSEMNMFGRQLGDLTGSVSPGLARTLLLHSKSERRENDGLSEIVAGHFAAKIADGALFDPGKKVSTVGATDILAARGVQGFEAGPKAPAPVLAEGEKPLVFGAPRGLM
ncbi:MAG: hypothetical protein H6857_01040 [Rhodospirillales bacterium]|nr:hypothetical protein [Rhodospirillales bacterium]